MRKIAKKFLFSAFILFLNSNFTTGQNTLNGSTKNKLLEKIDSIVLKKIEEYDIPGLSIGMVKYDSILYTKGYGIREINRGDLVTENSIFHTASISKIFTALAIVKLVERNSISLDDRLIDIIPELKYKDKRVKKITIKNLLNHTSGLPDIKNYHWENNHQSDKSLRDYILKLDLNLKTEPSTTFNYSNLGYDLLGYIIEVTTGATFDDFLKENILTRYGMVNSDFRYFSIPDSLKTSPHSKGRIFNKICVRKHYPYTREHAPSSTLNSSAKELSKWMLDFLEKINNSDEANLYRSMLEPSDSFPHIGLGFQLYDLGTYNAVGHFGGDKGFRSFLMMIPEKKIGLVILGNCDYNEDFRQEILFPVAELLMEL